MMTETRNSTCFRACEVIPGSSSQARDSRANPSGSRARIMFRASLRFLPPVSSHPSDGRMMSAPTKTSRELVISSSRDFESRPRSRSHPAGRSPHCPRASSAPEASHLSCQVCPGCSSSQSSSSGSPRRRLIWTRIPAGRRGCGVDQVHHLAAALRGSQPRILCRAGGIALRQSRLALPAAEDSGEPPALPSRTAVTGHPCRTARPSSRAGSRVPEPASSAQRPGGPAPRDGPGPVRITSSWRGVV